MNEPVPARAVTTDRGPSFRLVDEVDWMDLSPGDDFGARNTPLLVKGAVRYILDEFPQLRRDFAIKSLWPGLRWTWEYVFIGPANTVTGLHFDFPNNWFCQVRGEKEVVIIPPDQSPNMCRSKKYDWGATLSDVDVSRLDEQPRERAAFQNVSGVYARVEAGDALFIPRRHWHAVVALEPSISLAVFGLTPWEIVWGGGQKTALDVLHKLGLYRRGNCTCHEMAQAGAAPR